MREADKHTMIARDGGPLDEGKTDSMAALARVPAAEIVLRPAGGGWNAREIAYHLFDIERWYIAKLCEAATPNQAAALSRFMEIWSRLRDEAILLAAEIPDERLDQPGLLTGVPEWTPRSLIAAMAAHDREHAAQARAARGRPRADTGADTTS